MTGQIPRIKLKIEACFCLYQFIQRRHGAAVAEVEAAAQDLDDAEEAGNDRGAAPAPAGAPSRWRDTLAARAYADHH